MKMNFNSIVLLCLMVLSVLQGQAQFKSEIKVPDNVKYGVLNNGMHYYILHNEWPKDRVSFYFVQNVGAILEEDSQNGLAHFLEHMAFNGTQHFEGKGFIQMLEKEGVRFGADINAYTALDETVYNLSNIPTKKDWLVDSCLYVLHDWSGYLSLKPEEIDAERGVIREEYRTRHNASFRLQSQINPVLYKGSKYAERDVIGKLNVIENFNHQELVDYYEKWYRPDLQAIVVVGDIDEALMEKKIKTIFSTIPMPENAAKREYETVPDSKSTRFVVAKDREAESLDITYMLLRDKSIVKDKKYLDQKVLTSITTALINTRFAELLQNPASASLNMYLGINGMTRLKEAVTFQVSPKKGMTLQSYKEAYLELARAKQNGFTEGELIRIKAQIIASYKNYLNNQDKISNEDFANMLNNLFLEAEPFENPQDEYIRVESYLNSLNIEVVNACFNDLLDNPNALFILTGPDKKEYSYPTKKKLQKVMKEVDMMKLEPYKDADLSEKLIQEELPECLAVDSFAVRGVDEAKGYILSNGAKVIMLSTDYSNDQIVFNAFSNGGLSLIPTEDLPSAQLAVELVEQSGLGSFDALNLNKKLAGKVCSVNPFIGELTEGFQGSSNQQDFETMLQLIYLYFQHPGFDQSAYDKIQQQYHNFLENKSGSNSAVMHDSITLINSNYNERVMLFNDDYLKKISFEKSKSSYLQRFKNAADFTFVFVGNLEGKKDVIFKYLGAIPGDVDQGEFYVNHHIHPPKGIITKMLKRPMEEPKSTIYINIHDSAVYSKENDLKVFMIGQILSKKYLNTIREKEGGSYGVSVGAQLSKVPDCHFNLEINFDCNPDMKDKLMSIVDAQIMNLRTSLPDESELEQIKSSILKRREERKHTNSFWMSNIFKVLFYDEVLRNDEQFRNMIQEITPEDLQEYAKEILSTKNRVEVIMESENSF